MRARLWLLMLALLAIVGGGSAVQAQSSATSPLMVNEVRSWCPAYTGGNGTGCDEAAFSVRPDGAIHVIINLGSSGLDDLCIGGIQIPADVHGWAYVAGDAYQGAVVPVDQIPPGAAICELIVSR